MKKAALCFGLIALLLTGTAMAATEEAKKLAIDNGLAWLASTQTTSGAEGYWPYASYGTLAATAAAALAFVEAGYLPGDTSMYGDVLAKAVTYIFNRATVDSRFAVEPAHGYPFPRYAEDYNNDGPPYDGNNEAIFFNAGDYARTVYTTGIVSAVVYALGDSLGRNTVVGIGSAAIIGKTYAQAMQDIVDWFSWGQVEPNMGIYRGGWRYDANYGSSDNSTAQWGALPLLYASAWGLGVPQYVFTELEMWVNYIQNPSGGSGYDGPYSLVNISKTGGLLLELAAIGAGKSDPRVVAAVNYINGEWNTTVNGWDGNFNNAYSMWALYKGLQVQGYWPWFNCGQFQIRVGEGVPAAPGGFTICSEANPTTSAAGDWYSHYCDYLVGIQNGDGSWSGASSWTGSLATGWYINILKATEVPPPPPPCDLHAVACCDTTVECGGRPTTAVALDGSGSYNNNEPPFTYLWEAPGITFDDPTSATPIGQFPLGTTAVMLIVSTTDPPCQDADTVYVTVEDTTPPGIMVELNTYVLWPPNHKMVDIKATVTTRDICCVAPTFKLVSIASNEPDNAKGDGNTIGDIKEATLGRPDVAFQLRAERSGTGTGRIYTIIYAAVDCAGNTAYDTVQVLVPHDGSLEEQDEQIPGTPRITALLPSHPNPFNPTTTIPFDLATQGRVSLQIFDAQGRLVRTLCDEVMPEGTHEALWDGRDNSGSRVATGVYFVRFTSGNYQLTKKLVMVR